ncbi:tetratricopeptide repeat protein [Brevundimonas sp.]|jgi:superkiller protein 3|uniref:tetratricopeptide repeat protein n=1 Tax=Brevundimonas sp. TaxID=1871086 RepID=UPI0037C00609
MGREWAKASALYRRVVQMGRARASDWVRLARALDEGGDKPGAEAAYRRASAEFPLAYNVHRQFGLFLWSRGSLGPAANAFLRALALAPEEPLLQQDMVRLGGTPEGLRVRMLEAFLAAETPTAGPRDEARGAKGRRRAAKAAFRRGDWSAAVDLGLRLAAGRHTSPHDMMRLSLALKEAGRHEEALTANWRALALRPREPEFHLHLGHCLKVLGDPEAAASAYLAAWRLQPGRRDVGLELSGLGWSAAALEEAVLLGAKPGGMSVSSYLAGGVPDVAASRDRSTAQVAIFGDLMSAMLRNG